MDQKFPFSSYDFWAYLASGFLLLFVVDHVAGREIFLQGSWTMVQIIIAVSCAYVAGHLVASASSVVLEKVLVGWVLGYPRDVLLGSPTAWKIFRALFYWYFQPLPKDTRKALIERWKGDESDVQSEALFWKAYAFARGQPVVMGRLENFLNLYGFCRNIAVVAGISAVLFLGSFWAFSAPVERLWFGAVSACVAIGMTFRYLKFYRLYSLEVLTAFAYSKE